MQPQLVHWYWAGRAGGHCGARKSDFGALVFLWWAVESGGWPAGRHLFPPVRPDTFTFLSNTVQVVKVDQGGIGAAIRVPGACVRRSFAPARVGPPWYLCCMSGMCECVCVRERCVCACVRAPDVPVPEPTQPLRLSRNRTPIESSRARDGWKED
jgi:hypothetical protein